MRAIEQEYYDWLCSLVISDAFSSITYVKLFHKLYATEFTYILDMDENIYINGYDFRYRFAYEHGYSNTMVEQELRDHDYCSVFDVMVSLAFNVEDSIMEDYSYGNRTGQWFWFMISSLGLGSMDDDSYDEDRVQYILDNFMSRNYDKNGRGGLFTVENPPENMRTTEIWAQCMWFLDEFLEL